MFYLDTSFVVASLLQDEVGSNAARDWLASAQVGQLAISDWVNTEVSSALSLKVRTRQLNLDERAAALRYWRSIADASMLRLAIGPGEFHGATAYIDDFNLGLRAADALHLAIAQSSGCTLVTLDKQMAKAAIEVGVPVAKI